MRFWENTDRIVRLVGTTYRWLAEKLEVAETTVSGWRRTGVLPRADQALIIAKSLNVTVEYLLTGSELDSKHEDTIEIRRIIGRLPQNEIGRLTNILKAMYPEQELSLMEKASKRKAEYESLLESSRRDNPELAASIEVLMQDAGLLPVPTTRL